MKKGVIYARYSSHNQREESIEQQVAECTSFAVANNIEIIEVYSDKAVSGKTDKRLSFQRMMRDAERRKFEVVIAYKSNRIARNMLNALQYESKLERFGIETLYAKEEFGNTASGRFALRTMMNVNQFYSENLAEDVKRGLRDNAEQLKVNGSIPYGLRKGEDGRFEIWPERAAVIREIFDKVLHGVQFIDIAADLNARGIKTRQGNRWNKSSFVQILRNPAYIGTYHHSGVVVEDAIPPIIEKEVFYAVQKKLAEKSPYGKGHDYLLTGKLFCGNCGAPMVGICGTSRTGERYYYYVCQGKRVEHRCSKHNEPKDDLELKVARITHDIVLQDEFIEWLADAAINFQKELSRESGLGQLESDLADKQKAIKNLLKAIEAGIYTPSTRDRLMELEGEVDSLKQNIELCKAAYKPLDRDRIIFALQQLKGETPTNKRYQRMLFDTFIREVRVYDDKLEIDYFYTGKDSLVSVPMTSADSSESSYTVGYAPPYPSQTNQACEVFLISFHPSYFSLTAVRS